MTFYPNVCLPAHCAFPAITFIFNHPPLLAGFGCCQKLFTLKQFSSVRMVVTTAEWTFNIAACAEARVVRTITGTSYGLCMISSLTLSFLASLIGRPDILRLICQWNFNNTHLNHQLIFNKLYEPVPFCLVLGVNKEFGRAQSVTNQFRNFSTMLLTLYFWYNLVIKLCSLTRNKTSFKLFSRLKRMFLTFCRLSLTSNIANSIMQSILFFSNFLASPTLFSNFPSISSSL